MSRTHPRSAFTLFLDFDGVLNNDGFLRHQRNHGGARLSAPDNLHHLNVLCRELPVGRIVVTSSWRIGRSLLELRQLLADEGFEDSALIADATQSSPDNASGRSDEIRRYIERTGTTRWVALDDFALSLPASGHFFRTSGSRGLDHRLCEEVLSRLRPKSQK